MVIIWLQVRRARLSCEMNPCLNNGTCVDAVSPPYYRCICSPPSDQRLPVGAHCEPLSACDSMPCPDHSTCVVTDDLRAYKCVCNDKHCSAVTSLRQHDDLDDLGILNYFIRHYCFVYRSLSVPRLSVYSVWFVCILNIMYVLTHWRWPAKIRNCLCW